MRVRRPAPRARRRARSRRTSSPCAGSTCGSSRSSRPMPAELFSKLEPAEIYHQLLEHRWFLSQECAADVTPREGARVVHRRRPGQRTRRAAPGRRGHDGTADHLVRRPARLMPARLIESAHRRRSMIVWSPTRRRDDRGRYGVTSMSDIVHVAGREILDSRGNPTVEVEVVLDERCARAAPPCRAARRPASTRRSSSATAASATSARAC